MTQFYYRPIIVSTLIEWRQTVKSISDRIETDCDVNFKLIAAVISVCSNNFDRMAAHSEISFELIAAVICVCSNIFDWMVAVIFVFLLDFVANVAIVSFIELMLSAIAESSGN